MITRGDDITVVGISNMVMECLRAQEMLADQGIRAEVIDPIWLVTPRCGHHRGIGRTDRQAAGGGQRVAQLRS